MEQQQQALVDRTGAESDPLDKRGLCLLSLGMSDCYTTFTSFVFAHTN